MDDLHYQEHLHLLINRVRDALAAARSRCDVEPTVQASRVAGLLRMQASLERKLAEHVAAMARIDPQEDAGSVTETAMLDDDQSLEEKRRQYQMLEDQISGTRGKLPQLRADLTLAAFHALAEPTEIQRKQCEVDALVQKIALWSTWRDSLARQISMRGE